MQRSCGGHRGRTKTLNPSNLISTESTRLLPLLQGKRDDESTHALLLVMAAPCPARHQPGAHRRMFGQNAHDSLCVLKHRFSLLCKSPPHCRRRWPGLGRHPDHGAAEIPEQLRTLCRPFRRHAKYLPSGAGAMQALKNRFSVCAPLLHFCATHPTSGLPFHTLVVLAWKCF